MNRISIITINYNNGDGLLSTIQTVITQTCSDFEYIIIEGGSTDGSFEIIQQNADKISYWVSEKDNGQSAAINEGFSRATGDILCWVNSDDMLMPGAFLQCLKISK